MLVLVTTRLFETLSSVEDGAHLFSNTEDILVIERSGQFILFLYAVFLALLLGGIVQLILTPHGVTGLTTMWVGLAILVIGMALAAFTWRLKLAMFFAMIGLAIDFAGINIAKGNVVAEAAIAAFTATVVFGWVVYIVRKRFRHRDVMESVQIIHVK